MNKKLIKSIVSITCGSGVVATIPLATTSCGYSSSKDDEYTDVLPYEVYEIKNNVLMGFTSEFLADQTKYDKCYTMKIPAHVKSISDSAFYKDSSSLISGLIKNLTFEEGSDLTTIGQTSFCYAQISSVDFTNCTSLTTIGQMAFYSCSSLTSIDLSNCTESTTIADGAFEGCSSLTSVTFPNNLTAIDDYAFAYCSSLTSISFPSSLTNIGSTVFNNCPKLNEIKWNAWNGSFENLSSTSFSGVCKTGGAVTITNPVGNHIAYELLHHLVDNGGLPEAWIPSPELPESVYDIDETTNVLKGFKNDFLNNPSSEIYKDNFQDCSIMEIPASVTSINTSAFYSDSDSTIPSYIDNLTFEEGSNLATIGKRAFFSCSSITSVDFSNCSKLNTIGDEVFTNCSELASIDYSNCTSLDEIGNYAFYNCLGLTSATFPSNLTKIGVAAFFGCSGLTLIDLSKCTRLDTIGQYAFKNCSKLDLIDLSNCTSLTEIDDYAFEVCSKLTSVTFPNSLKTISRNAFYNCSNLNQIKWNAWNGNTTIRSYSFNGVCPDGGTVTVIDPIDDYHGSDALLNCLLNEGNLPVSWAKDVTNNPLPESVYDIDEVTGELKGFKTDVDLSRYKYACNTMQIPASVKSISNRAFYNEPTTTIPSFISNLTFEEGSDLTTIGLMSFGFSLLTSIDFTNCTKLTTISGSAFIDCSITFADLSNCTKLIAINTNAFQGCSLTSIVFPSSLNTIESYAFHDCLLLSSIVWEGLNNAPAIGDSAFSSVASKGTVESTGTSYTSDKLLVLLKTKGLPSGWTVA